MAKKTDPAGELHRGLKTTPIAIIGMASIFPQAHNLDEYWNNILDKINCISDVPASRWKIEDYYDPDPKAPDKVYCKKGGFLPDNDFDPLEFGLPPNILEVTDVSQLLSLVVARDVLEDAGYGENRDFNRELTGVILGVVGMSSKLVQPLFSRLQYPVWQKVLRSAGVSEADTQRLVEKFKSAYVGWEENAFPGTIANVIAGRICNRFDLGGTNCVIDAACGSSMAAVRMAIMELVEHRAELMISGGVDADNSILSYMCFSKTPAFSKGEVVRAFDAEADGMMVGEGLGMLALKRLEDAERDGDRIYAVIRGIGSSSDGRYKSIYAPRSEGQAKALRRAYEDAGFSPQTVGLVEAHGTGTMAGDPAEFGGMKLVFGENNHKKQTIALGSVKSQIGHTKAAAGAASLIKVALSLHHKVLPPTLNVTHPNPKLEIEDSPFYLNTELRPWMQPAGSHPRRAGVSSFGFGGTNFHVVLEEYQADHKDAYRHTIVPQMIVLDAPTQAMLVAKAKDTFTKLKGEGGAAYMNELGKTSQERQIPLHHARIGFVADSVDEAVPLLQMATELMQEKADDEAWESPKGIFYRKSGVDPKGKLVALFPGQGAQYVDMGKELAINFPTVRQVFAAVDGLFAAEGEESLSGSVYPIPVFDPKDRDRQNENLTKTQNAQPAIGALSVAVFKLLQQAGFKPDFCAGHSFGELTALWAAGVLTDKDYYALAKARGKAMAPPADPNFDAGTMLAVKGDVEKIRQELGSLPDVTLANWNSNNQVVLAGSRPAIAQAQQVLTEKGYSAMPLSVSAAFHTQLVGHAQKPFAEMIEKTPFQQPKARVFSNSTGKEHSNDPKEIQAILKQHILNPVLWKDEIESIFKAGGYFFIECGPKNILTNLVDNILAGQPHVAVAMNTSPKKDSDRQFREAAVKLKVAGLDLGVVDPFSANQPAPVRKHSAVTVKLGAGLFVSEKTRLGFEKALNDGFKLTLPAAPAQALATIEEKAEPVVAAPKPVEKLPAAAPIVAPVQPAPIPAVVNTTGDALARLQTQQSEATHIHEKYLENESEYGRIFVQTTQLGMSLVTNPGATPQQIDQALTVLQSIERSMMRFHDHQSDTLRVHEQYLKNQEEYARNTVQLASQQLAVLQGSRPVVVTPTPAVTPAPTALPAVKKPIEEVRRVEPVVTVSDPPPVTTAPKNGNGKSHAPVEPPQAATAKPVAVVTPAPVSMAAPVDSDAFAKALLGVVSEKTGYPPEMLDLSMDMEADLGIDSIKRVEIVGTVREMYPSLPKMEPETFSELRTLGQIIDFMNQTLGAVSLPVSQPPIAVEAVLAALSDLVSPVVSAARPGMEQITGSFLTIVSDKTGYPQEMLDLDMDMEADLGIDSIKRVEILGAVREIYSDLPKIAPEEFAELRSLRQVIDHVFKALPGALAPVGVDAIHPPVFEPVVLLLAEAPVSPEPVASPAPVVESSAAGSSLDSQALTQALLNVVSEKTGYPTEMLELNMDMEADLGIDSIKKVEIMGAMRQVVSDLPKAEPEAFAEARTLGQVVAYLSQLMEATPIPFSEGQR